MAFVTSLRHPHNSADYNRVELLLSATLDSICAQNSADFRVFVVGNKEPGFELPEKVEFIAVDFPPPTEVAGPQTGREAVLRDKGTKLAIGLLAAAKHHPSHYMVVDADDFVSRRLATLVADSPAAPGWVVDRGYQYSDASQLVQRVDRFNERCGSSLILKASLFDLPDVPLSATQDELIDGLGEFTVRELLGSHRIAVSHFAKSGSVLSPVPFPGAVYRVDTGENHSGKSFSGLGRPVTAKLADEFRLPVSISNPRVLLASVLSVGDWVQLAARAVLRRVRSHQ